MVGTFDPCTWCEEVLQPYLDRQLSETERAALGTTLRQRVVAGHSVDAWADRVLQAVAA